MPCNEISLRLFLETLATQTGALALFGDAGQAALAFALANNDVPTDDPVRVSLDRFVLCIPLAAFRNWFYETPLPTSQSANGKISIGGMEFCTLHRAACAQQPFVPPLSTPVNDPRTGIHLGQVTTGDVLAREMQGEHQFLYGRIREIVRLSVPLSEFAAETDVRNLLRLPLGLASAVFGKLDDVLLAAHDLGLIGENDLPAPYHFTPSSQPFVGPGSVSAVRRRMYARSMNATEHFGHFLALYQVLEHAFLDSHVEQVRTELAAGNSGKVIALWSKRTAERALLEGVIKRILPSVSSSLLRSSYPAKGHALYLGCGLKADFEITTSNFEDKISGLIYDVRCSIVHTKGDQAFLEPSPSVLSILATTLIPDVRTIARALILL